MLFSIIELVKLHLYIIDYILAYIADSEFIADDVNEYSVCNS